MKTINFDFEKRISTCKISSDYICKSMFDFSGAYVLASEAAERERVLSAEVYEAVKRARETEEALYVLKERERGLVEALELADVHIEWGDASLESVHTFIRSSLAQVKEE